MTTVTMRDRFRYRFDNFMSRGGRSIFISLTAVFVGLLTIIGVLRTIVLWRFNEAAQWEGGVLRNIYITFLQMTDPGNMAQDISSGGGFKVTAILAGLAGVVMLSVLIAFITTALDRRLSQLRKGHSRVVEEGHTLILGWDERRVLEILRELILANESEKDAVVVILAEEDKEAMDDYLAIQLSDTVSTRIVTRSGNPAAPINLRLAAVETADSVIVLNDVHDTAADADKAASDARSIKALLAVRATRGDSNDMNVVAELFDHGLHDIARSISPDEITTLDSSEILAKILVQTSRSVGLSVVYNEILSFDGSEMYFDEGEWSDVSFGDMSFHYPDGVPMGVRTEDGEIFLNPPPGRPMQTSDDILILATDDSTIEYLPDPVHRSSIPSIPAMRLDQALEHELIVGWTQKASTIVREYGEYVMDDSTIDVMLRSPSPVLAQELRQLDIDLPQLRINVIDRDPMKPATWDEIQADYYDNVLILSQRNEEHDADRIDAETIMILLLLRQILNTGDGDPSRTKLITELVESDNQSLATHAGVNDFVISNRFISMLLAQISQEKDIHAVYETLFDEDGSEIYLKPASLYFDSLPVTVAFGDLMKAAQLRDEVCLGVKIKANERVAAENFGVTLIPPKTSSVTLGADDSLVVVAEDET